MRGYDTGFARSAKLSLRDYRADSFQSHQFLSRDFSSMAAELAKVFSKQSPPLRFVPVVWRVSRDLAPMYARRCDRKLSGVPDATAAQLTRGLNRAGIDRMMRTASRQAVVQNLQVVSSDPLGPEDVRLRVWNPFEVYVEFSDPLEDDIRLAERVCLRTPISSKDGYVEYGMRVYTQDAAVVTRMDGTTVIADIFAGGTNPFDGIPLAAYRREESSRGMWYPPIAQDLLAVQIGVNLVLSFVEHIGRYQGHTMRLLTGAGAKIAAQQVYDGPNLVTAFPADDVQVTVHDPSPPTDKTLAALDTTMRLFGASNFVDVQSLLSKSTGITGDAKALEKQDAEQARRELELDLEEFETDIANLALKTMRLRGLPRAESETVKVSIDYRYVEPRRNDLQTLQAQQGRFGYGLDAPSLALAREMGVSPEEALPKLLDNLREMAEIRKARIAAGLVDEPGLPLADNNQPGA